MYYDQSRYEVRCEWGLQGVEALAPESGAIVIVDVLSFTTCVDVALANGAVVYPCRWRDESSIAFAQEHGAVLAGGRGKRDFIYSLSPRSLAKAMPGEKIVLPSPNGSTLTLATGDTPTLAGCLRNAAAVASQAQRLGQSITVIPAGERWPDESLRPAIEDLIGAGSIIAHLSGSKSPEAAVALAAFEQSQHGLLTTLMASGSGRELVQKGYTTDVEMSAELNVSSAAPVLVDGKYLNQSD